jgi:2-(1,2-epoxy-1,2-dihydrophenyl)acetyl-CoA isomerase
MSGEVLWRHADGIGTITLNRPDRLNAMNRPLSVELLAVLDRAAADPDVRTVVLTGAGRALSAGGDRTEEIDDSVIGVGSQDLRAARLRAVMRSTEIMRHMPKIVIAAVNGPCFGAALAIACAADVRIAASTAQFGTAFVPAALPGDFGGTWLLPRIVGDGVARDLYLLAEPFDAARAERIGLISRCHEPAEFAAAVAAVAGRAAALPATAVRLAKANLNDAAGIDLSAALDLEARRTVECIDSAEAEQERQAFRTRRAQKDDAGQELTRRT